MAFFLGQQQTPLVANYVLDYNEQLHKAYLHCIQLDFDEAQHSINQVKKDQPNNLAVLHIENYIDFFTIFITEEKRIFDSLENNKSERLRLIKKHIPDDDPFKRFALAEINLQWALIRAKFDQLFKSGRELWSAYNLLKENRKLFPEFPHNCKSLSVIHSLIGTISIPGMIKYLFKINGSIDQGILEAEALLKYSNENDFFFHYEAEAIYAFILFYQKNAKDGAWDFINQSRLAQLDSPLSNFLIANLGHRSGKTDLVINLLEKEIAKEKTTEFLYLHYLLGLCKLRKLDPSSNQDFKYFLTHFKGQHYIKDAHQKLAWYHIVMYNDLPAYKFNIEQCISTGNSLIDDDKQALKEAQSDIIPNPILLQARLLFDGGYYLKAQQVLIKHAHLFYKSDNLSLEYFYRLGRIAQELENYTDALDYFDTIIDNNVNSKNYMVANAMLQAGIILEKQEDYNSAISYYNKCLRFQPNEYKNSIHQKAKSGLDRINKL